MNTEYSELASLFNEKKLRILFAIYKCSDNVCACDISGGLNIPKNLLSYHVKTLKKSGLIEEVKCGRFRSYKIKKDKLVKIKQIFIISGML